MAVVHTYMCIVPTWNINLYRIQSRFVTSSYFNFFPLLEHYSYILILKLLELGCSSPPGACVSLKML